MLTYQDDTDGIFDLLSTALTDANNNILISETIRIIGENPQFYPVDGGRLIMLIPKSFHSSTNREILLKDVVDSFALKTDFKSRLGMIYNAIERIEFVFYESPKGDLICEFPLYDFDPDDFNVNNDSTQQVSHYNTLNNIVTEDSAVQRGPFGPRYTIAKRDTYNFSKGITDEKIRTQIASSWHPVQNYVSGVGTLRDIAKPAVVTLRHLVPLYWLRIEEVAPKGFIASEKAALLYIQIMLNKTNADARTLGINAAPNLGLWLNRPIYFAPRNCIGTLMGLGHNITWGMGGSMDTRINLTYIRGWDGLLDNKGKVVYTPIGGMPSRPLNYKILFKLGEDVEQGAANIPSTEADLGSGNG